MRKKNNGCVDKFIGDAILASWGALRSSRSTIPDALSAALDMRRALIDFNKVKESGRVPPLQIGIGLNYGPVISGQIGSNERMEYTVIGDAVNVASRVQDATKNYGIDILVTESIYTGAGRDFVFQKLDEITLKGKSKPIQIYVLLGKKGEDVPVNIDELRIRIGYRKPYT